MQLRRRYLCLESLEARDLPSLPASAPLLGPPPPSANVIWVNTVLDLQKAIVHLQSNQTLVIQKGTYHLTGTPVIGWGPALQNITIRGQTDNPDDTVLVGAGMEVNVANGGLADALAVYNAQNVTIANLALGDTWLQTLDIQPGHGANAVHLYHLHMFDAGEQFIKQDSGGSGTSSGSVQYCTFEYTVAPPVLNHGGDSGYTNGLDVHGGSNWVVSDSLFRNFHTPDWAQNLWDPAVLIWDGSSNDTVTDNTFLNCDRAIALGLVNRSKGFDDQGGLISNNFIYQSPGLFSAARKRSSDGQILVWDSPNTRVYQNTVLTNGNSVDSIQVRWSGGADLRNNLADAPFLTRNGGSFTQAGNYLSATPALFVSPTTGDLHLVYNTATVTNVIGKAAYLAAASQDFDGDPRPPKGGVDIGADEYTPPKGPIALVLDTNDAGYSETGTGWRTLVAGYINHARFHAAGTGTNTAAWQLQNLPVLSYAVSVTWPQGNNQADNATYQVYDGSTLLGKVSANQALNPTGTKVNGVLFQTLGTFKVSSGKLTVILSDNADGYVVADALRIVSQ
jgi:hypothetical protein